MITNFRKSAIAESEIELLLAEEEGWQCLLEVREIQEKVGKMQLKMGQLLVRAKEIFQRRFGTKVEEAQLVKTQMSKLIKAVDIADTLPGKLAPKLGLHILLQLGQKRNEDAIAHLTDEDTQLSVTQKIKEHRQPAKPKMPKPAMGWERNREGDRTLVIRLIDSDVARFVESGYKQSGLPLPLYMTSLLEGNGKAWEKAQQELAEYMEAQSEDTAPTLKIGDKVTVAGQVGTIADFEFKQLLNQTYPVIAWESGGKSALAPQNVKKVVDVQKSEIEQLLAQIKRCDECIELLANPQDGTEQMIRRAAIEDKEKAEKQLASLCL